MPRARTHWTCLLVLAGAVALLTATAQASLVGPSLMIRADPCRVPADGEARVVIFVEVTDAFGAPAPDGTAVHFVTTLGEILSPVETLGGLAQTVLMASNTTGMALVSAIVGGVRSSTEVEFLAAPGSASPGSRMIELTADELSYSADRQVFVATWAAELKYQTIEIRADSIQYDMKPKVVCAQGNVMLRSGTRVLEADALRYELGSLRGRLLRITGEVEKLLVEGDALETRPDTAEDSCLWEPLRTDETRTWVKARRAVIQPGRKIILDHATFYVDGTRVMSLRRHVLEPGYGSAVFGNALGYSSGAGVNLDFPFYYRASGRHVGSLHISRNRMGGGARYEPGWAVGLREEYIREGHSEGSFALDDVLHPDRGVRWEHRHELGGGARCNLDASVVTFEDGGPRLRSSGLNVFRPVGGGRLSLAASRSDFGASEHYFTDLSYRTRTFHVGSGVLMNPVFHLRHSWRHSDQSELLVDVESGEVLEIARESTGRTTSPGINLNFDLPARQLGSKTQLTARLMTGYAWGLSGGGQSVLDGHLSLTRRFGPTDHVRLSYDYASTPASIRPSVFTFGRQRLRLNGTATIKQFSVRANASRELDGSRLFGTVSVSRALPFGSDAVGRPFWSIEASHFFSHIGEYSLASSRFAVTRLVGRYRAALCYSPEGHGQYDSRPWVGLHGYGYTYSGGRNLWLELSAATY